MVVDDQLIFFFSFLFGFDLSCLSVLLAGGQRGVGKTIYWFY